MNINEQKNLITPQAADILISRRDPDMTLLYLYLCRTSCQDPEQAGRDLFFPKQRLNEAYERLEMCGLLPSVSAPQPDSSKAAPSVSWVPQDTELPETYTAADVRNRAEQDSAFSALINEARLIIGRPLSSPDLIKMLGIYDHLNLPAEVIMELMHHVADIYREKYGESRRPSVRAFENEARDWVERGITDFDAAEQHIRTWRERKSLDRPLKDAMNIRDRDFTDTERRYITAWLDFGFGPDAIHLAYDKTVTNTRKFSLAYMNKILLSWHEKGLHTMKEIQDRDRPARRQESSGAASVPADPRAIQEIIKQI